ncbi:MAG: hypothetical protein ACREXQ_14780 [Polaromonas sp.]
MAEIEDYRIPGHLFLAGTVLHLLYESTLPNKRLKLAARVDCGMNPSSARRSLSAVR